MVKLREELRVAIGNSSKEDVMLVLNDILEYAIDETDGNLIQRTIEIIHIMKEEN